MHGLFVRYAAQPTEPPFDNMTLAHFAVWYKNVHDGTDRDQSIMLFKLPIILSSNSFLFHLLFSVFTFYF